MSVPSFPRDEHVALLRQRIEERLRERNLPLEVAERGLNRYRCQYRFGFRRPPAEDWAELSLHFQIAARLARGEETKEFDLILDEFLDRNFP